MELSPSEVVQKIKDDLLNNKHLTLGMTAKKLGKNPNNFYIIMNGNHRISPKVATQLHKEFGYSIPFLTKGEGEMLDPDWGPKPKMNPKENSLREIKDVFFQCYSMLERFKGEEKIPVPEKVMPEEFDVEMSDDGQKIEFTQTMLWVGLVNRLSNPEMIAKYIKTI